MQSPQETQKPWYREFWAWFILAPLLLVVVVSTYTVSLAVRHADDRVVDNYYKEGRMINVRLDEDLVAVQLQLVADIAFDQKVAELVVQLSAIDQTFPDAINLELSHPSDQELDHQVQLQHIAQGQYQAELDRELSYRWYLRLRPADPKPNTASVNKKWRLRGEIDFSQHSSVRLTAEL